MFSLTQAQLRLIRPEDLDDVMRIQAQAYSDEILETREVMRARLDSVANTSWVVECNGQVYAYLLAYLSCAKQVTPWGKPLLHQDNADTFYLHDLAISDAARGFRLGPWLVERVLAQLVGSNLRHAALVSVQGTQGFWEKLGFVAELSLPDPQQVNLQTYNSSAVYMARPL